MTVREVMWQMGRRLCALVSSVMVCAIVSSVVSSGGCARGAVLPRG